MLMLGPGRLVEHLMMYLKRKLIQRFEFYIKERQAEQEDNTLFWQCSERLSLASIARFKIYLVASNGKPCCSITC